MAVQPPSKLDSQAATLFAVLLGPP